MNNKALVLFAVIILIFASGCLGENETPVPGTYEAPLKSDMAVKEIEPVSQGITDILERKIISTASLSMEVKSVQATFNEITRIVQASGGFISSSSTYDAAGRKSGDMTVRVPQKNFYSTIEQVEALGTVKSKQISGQDVTEEFIDLSARLDNLKKQESRLQEILKTATTVKDVLEVEKELERVRGEIERLTGRLNYLNQSVEMSTISVSASEPAPIAGEGLGITDALKEAVRGFIESVKGIIIFIGYILPIAVFIAVVIAVVLWFKRKVLPRLR